MDVFVPLVPTLVATSPRGHGGGLPLVPYDALEQPLRRLPQLIFRASLMSME